MQLLDSEFFKGWNSYSRFIFILKYDWNKICFLKDLLRRVEDIHGLGLVCLFLSTLPVLSVNRN